MFHMSWHIIMPHRLEVGGAGQFYSVCACVHPPTMHPTVISPIYNVFRVSRLCNTVNLEILFSGNFAYKFRENKTLEK